jgi:RNA polymerase sigma factor (sigma-70 family)
MLRKVANVFATGSDRDDLMQKMLGALWKAMPGFRGDAKASTFIYRVVHNCALTWVRGENRRRHRESTASEEHVSRAGTTPQTDARVELLHECLRELRGIDRSIVTMSLDGLGHAEIGDVIGSSENAVSVRIRRIRKQLATAMERKGNQYEH